MRGDNLDIFFGICHVRDLMLCSWMSSAMIGLKIKKTNKNGKGNVMFPMLNQLDLYNVV